MNNIIVWLSSLIQSNTSNAEENFFTMQKEATTSYIEQDSNNVVDVIMKELRRRTRKRKIDRSFKVNHYLKHTEDWYVTKLQKEITEKLNTAPNAQQSISYAVKVVPSADNSGHIPDTVHVSIQIEEN